MLFTLSLCFYNLSSTIDLLFMRNQRRIGEAIMIASGFGLALGAFILGINFLSVRRSSRCRTGNSFSALALVFFYSLDENMIQMVYYQSRSVKNKFKKVNSY